MGVEMTAGEETRNLTVPGIGGGAGADGGRGILFVVASLVLALILAHYIGRRLLCSVGSSGRRRYTLLLLGLCGSGKTTLFAQLVAGKHISARTSMQPNRGSMPRRLGQCIANGGSASASAFDADADSGVTVVDFPGHRRLRESLTRELEEALNVVIVVDTVMIHDDRHEGAQALAELVVSVFTSPAFYGVKHVLVACTKRDELTSYSAKAVRKLLEAEITRCIATRHGDVQRLDSVVNSAGVAIGRAANGGVYGRSSRAAARTHELPLGESGKFTFDGFAVPVHFADVSSFVDPPRHPFNVDPVWKFVEEFVCGGSGGGAK